jgi:hypothetical protein
MWSLERSLARSLGAEIMEAKMTWLATCILSVCLLHRRPYLQVLSPSPSTVSRLWFLAYPCQSPT